MTELRPIPGYEGLYSITEDGRIFSYQSGKWRAHGIDRNGYHQITLHKQGASHTVFVHTLVLSIFVGPPREDQIASHEDDDKDNNHFSNLKWRTDLENKQLSVRNGRHKRGVDAAKAKLTEQQVREVRSRRQQGETLQSLASSFGVRVPAIHDIVRRRSWRHVE